MQQLLLLLLLLLKLEDLDTPTVDGSSTAEEAIDDSLAVDDEGVGVATPSSASTRRHPPSGVFCFMFEIGKTR